jgi:hypothetical protein
MIIFSISFDQFEESNILNLRSIKIIDAFESIASYSFN